VHAASLTRALPGQESDLTGCLELYFTGEDDALAAAQGDVAELLTEGTEVSRRVAGLERVVMRMPDFFKRDMIKGVYPFCRKDGMTVAAFQQHWWQVHGPIAALTENALGYIQIHPFPAYYSDVDHHYDGITEIYWPDEETASEALVSRQMVEDQGSDAPNFVDLDSIALFLAKEEIVIQG
jgi:uncharacterized protein (TIGR02118 family)